MTAGAIVAAAAAVRALAGGLAWRRRDDVLAAVALATGKAAAHLGSDSGHGLA